MKTSILQGSVFDVLPTLPAGSVDCCVSSPPYWQLRSYLPKNHPLKSLELGSEKTPAEFVQNMVLVFQEVRRVLADHGTVWLNIGDTYSGGGSGWRPGNEVKTEGNSNKDGAPIVPGIPAGNLCLIPQRLAIALQDDGWIIRSVIVWHKPAPMPSSVSGWAWRRCRVKVSKQATRTDNKKGALSPQAGTFKERYETGNGVAEWRDCSGCTKCTPHGGYVLRRGSWRPTSSWEPILMLAKSDRYFCDGEAVKQPSAEASISRALYPVRPSIDAEAYGMDELTGNMAEGAEAMRDASAGANLRDVWRTTLSDMSKEELIEMLLSNMGSSDLQDTWKIAAEPLKEAHYAAFPSELVYRCLKAGTSAKGYCPECGAPWVRVVESHSWSTRERRPGMLKGDILIPGREDEPQQSIFNLNGQTSGVETTTLGWRPSCSHISEPRAGVVLDPFSGSGRTGLEARRLGLDYIGVELNPAYVEMSQRILWDDAPLFV